MNRFQKEVVRRRKKVLKIVGIGTLTKRQFETLIKEKLKDDIKTGKFKIN